MERVCFYWIFSEKRSKYIATVKNQG